MKFCKGCSKPIPDTLDYCSLHCLDKQKFGQKTSNLFDVNSATNNLVCTDDDSQFTIYAKSTGKERKRLGKMIDDNYELCKEYIEVVRYLREKNPKLRKFSFKEWLKWKNQTTKKASQTTKEILSHA